MPEKPELQALIAELEAHVELLADLERKNQRAAQRAFAQGADELDWAALGYTLHNIYNLLESYFLRVAKFFENALDPASWHRDLVMRMTLTIDGVRPSVLSRELAAKIDALRAFRHVFRNIYQTGLDPRRVRLVQDELPQTLQGFAAAHAEFINKLKILAEHLEG